MAGYMVSYFVHVDGEVGRHIWVTINDNLVNIVSGFLLEQVTRICR